MKKLLPLILCLISFGCAAQTSPGFIAGQIPSAANWDSYFSSKLDYQSTGIYSSIIQIAPIGIADGLISIPTVPFQVGTAATDANNPNFGWRMDSCVGINNPLASCFYSTSQSASYPNYDYITAAIRSDNGDNYFNARGYATLASFGVPVLSVRSFGGITAVQLGNPNLGRSLISDSVPTIVSGFGSGADVTSNGSAAFRVGVGSGGTANSGVLNLGAIAAHYWNCTITNITATSANRADQRTVQINPVSFASSQIRVQNQTISTGAAVAWNANDILAFMCLGV